MWRKENSCALFLGISVATMENSMEILLKIGYLLRGNKNTKSKRYMYSHFHCSIIYNSQYMEVT